MAIAASAIAQQAFDGETEWFESDGQGAPESTQMFAAAMVNVPDQAPIDLTDGLPAHNATVGSVAGEAGVSGGAATYSIPIVVPPGRRGMQPEVGLSYSSRAGNGIAGMGWSLSGLSSIHRCPQTIEQDGAIRPVQLDGSDRLCLDGQRLVATSGTYGSVSTQYKTELDSFARITQLGGTLASETSYFKVELKSGEIVWYGGTSTGTNAARVIPGGASFPLSWLIERRQDRSGNLVRYAYTDQSNGEVLLSSIAYTGFGTTDGNRKVAFTYETRPTAGGANDQSSSYLAGGLTRQSRRLKTILTTVGTEKVREYVLTYQTSAHSGRSLLNSIVDCAYDGAARYCKPATDFAWQQSAPAWQFDPLPIEASAGPPGLMDRVISIRPLGDVNGDGAIDSMLIASVAGNPSAREIYLGSLTADRRLSRAILLPASSHQLAAAHIVDFDLDGRMDFVSRDPSNNLVVWFWHGPVNATSFSAAFNASFNTGIEAPLTGGGLEHVGDMDGDGRADLVISRDEGTGASSCGRRVKIYRNVSSGGSGMPTQFSEAANYCLARTIQSGYPFLETVQGIRDADGDGLPDIWVKSYLNGGIQSPDLDRIVYGRRSPGYALAPQPYSSLFPASDPMQGFEDDSDLFSLWTDVNGDGLDDLVYARSDGKWTLRLHIGKGVGNRILLPNNNGIERCLPADLCGSGSGGNWRPWYGARIRAADYDADGRFELLIPRHFAARHCQQLVDYSDPNEPEAYFACTEDYETGIVGFTQAQFDDGDAGRVRGSYRNGLSDLSAYRMAALRFVETAPNQFAMVEVPTNIVLGADGGGYGSDDLFGDGLSDLLTRPGCVSCVIPIAYANGTPIPEESSPRQLPGGYSVHTSAMFLNENAGPGGTPNLDGLTPKTPDLMSMATDGLGNQAVWTYYPLSSKAGRTAGETPLYTVPTDAAARYVDDRHFYFTSSMQVVSEMIQSDGLGDHRAWRYGYSEAMYNARGRGFQGFRKIIEEDEAAGTRTTTTFHQKFPLTSQPEQIVVNSLNRSGVTAPISLQKFTWRCNRADRADIAACAPATPTAVRFPFLDMQETWTYDAATADNPGGGTPPLVSYRRQTNADVCIGTQPVSGYDAYGNLKVGTVLVQDGTGSGGYRSFVTKYCTVTESTYAAADTTNWWVDKLESRTVTNASIIYDATNHPLPAGTSNPIQTLTTTYTWNANRTPATETMQPGIADQERVTTYGYSGNNYGLPTSATVTASGDPNGSRKVETTYSPDGYFPQTVKNPLLHQVTTITRARDGQPTMITDANGLRTIIEYDPFGFAKLTKFRGMTDGERVAPDRHVRASWCAIDGCVANGKYFVRTIQDGTPTNTTVFDQLRRPLRSRTRLLDETDSIVDTQYDARGLVSRQSAPFRDLAERLWTEYTGYDVLGRLTGKIEPQPNQDGRGHRVTTYTYSGRQTAIKACGSLDPASRCLNMTRTTDSLGRYMETVDAKAGITKFWYDSAGNALAIRDANQNVIRAIYNALGQRTSVSDPNQGSWSFGYNALGEVLAQTDARNLTTSMQYDKLGRPWQVSATVDIDGVAPLDTVLDTFTYDPAYAKGLEGSQSRTINGALQREITITYDLLSRPASVTYDNATATPGTFLSLTQETAFDVYYGRPKAQSYGNGETLWLRYSKYGQPIRESDAATGADYRVVTAVDVRGNAIAETLAGGELGVAHSYHPQTGQVASIRYANLSNPNLRVLTYAYDVFGNLGQQTLGGATQEEFTYDALHRLTEATRTGTGTGTVQYGFDAVGNFSSKSDFSLNQPGAYSYSGGTCGGGPNAVKTVQLQAGGTRSYCYDANGNLTSDSAGLVMKYDHTQRPVQIVRGGITRNFRYDATGSRFWQFGSGESTQYFPGVEKRYGAINDEKTYLGSRTVVTTQGGVRRVETLLTDRLGSVEAVANDDGAMIESRGYDAFGKPRTGTWANAPNDRLGTVANTPHGFTGHEHLNSVGLIHMNGRVYDYALGRFTGVDPVIQFPLNSQSHNPYSYILNNPLSGTDPTGYMYEWRGECKGRQGCEMQRNKLNDLQAEIQGIAGVMGAGANSSRVTAGREARNGARTGDVQVGKLEKVADIDASNTRSNGPALGGGSGCYSDCAATTYPYRDIDRGTDTIVGLHPYDIAMEQASRERAFANEGIEPVTFVEETVAGGKVIKGGLLLGAAIKRSMGGAAEAGAVTLRGASAEGAARAIPRLKVFDKAGIETTEHFRNRLAQRGSRGITERNALDAYQNGRLYYNEATGNYVRHSSRTGVSVVTDAPSGGRAITVFEGNPSPGWNPVPWRPGQ